MKKFTWVFVFLTALVLVLSGCPGGGDGVNGNGNGSGNGNGTDDNINLLLVFSATPAAQDKAGVTVSQNGAVFTTNVAGDMWGELVAPEASTWNLSAYTGIKFEYKAPHNFSIFLQDTTNMFIFGFNGSDGWGAISFVDDWTEITLPFSILIGNDWFGDNSPLNKASVIKLMFGMATGSERIGDKVEIRNLKAY